jgi:hypothetical protein
MGIDSGLKRSIITWLRLSSRLANSLQTIEFGGDGIRCLHFNNNGGITIIDGSNGWDVKLGGWKNKTLSSLEEALKHAETL